MTTEIENATKMVERHQLKAVTTAGTIVVDDGTNEAKIPGFPYIFLAKGDNILVAVDIFKTGYECKTCHGTAKIKQACVCDTTDNPGFKYNLDQLKEVLDTLGETVAASRSAMKCPECEGDYLSKRKEIPCPDCKGRGALLHTPDTSKTLPTTGVIVSLGSEVNPALGYKNGQRVLFGAYVGVMIPTKAPGVVFKVLRSLEILCEIKGGEDMANFDFVIIDKDL